MTMERKRAAACGDDDDALRPRKKCRTGAAATASSVRPSADLPDAILAHAFSWVTAAKHNAALQLVCRRWCNIARTPAVWKHVRAKFHSEDEVSDAVLVAHVRQNLRYAVWRPDPDCDPPNALTLLAASFANLHSVRVGTTDATLDESTATNLALLCPSLQHLEIPFFASKLPATLTSLRMDVEDGQNLLAASFANLHSVRVGTTDATLDESTATNLALLCPSLQHLEIPFFASKLPATLTSLRMDVEDGQNLLAALRECPHLTRLTSCGERGAIQWEDLSAACPALTYLKVWGIVLPHHQWKPGDFQLRQLKLGVEEENEIFHLRSIRSWCSELRRLKLYVFNDDDPTSSNLHFVLESCSHIESVDYQDNRLGVDFLKEFEKFPDTLHELKLDMTLFLSHDLLRFLRLCRNTNIEHLLLAQLKVPLDEEMATVLLSMPFLHRLSLFFGENLDHKHTQTLAVLFRAARSTPRGARCLTVATDLEDEILFASLAASASDCGIQYMEGKKKIFWNS
eukprot:TRINITY_DN4088_c1_g3_i2.p1 TRINITY_DN4088_c1_g3~~TRINITY_DN4088_c1_g3_i2.p1  ORF type:complete len:514 (-),score=112.44 TRINITY_DN4088_c1_g3_i2:156-1697(-)